MNVLSLFDGISCGSVALKRAGIQVDTYYASEIEESSIKIAKANYPNIIEVGNVCALSYDADRGMLFSKNGNFHVGEIDILIGGSPCTDFSSIGYANGMTAENEEICTLEQYLSLKEKKVQIQGQSYLFWEYIRILNEVKPRFFLLENVVMAKKWQSIITKAVGVEPLAINSSLLSAQNRPRLYWTNIPNVEQPQDKNIVLSDVLSKDAAKDDVSECQTVQKCFAKLNDKYGYIPCRFNAYNVTELQDKACALSRGSMVTSSCATLLFVKVKDGKHTVENGMFNGLYPTKLRKGRYNLRRLSFKEMEHLQTLPDDYTKVDGVGKQKRSAAIGNGWTVDVIAHIFSYMKAGV